jgi:hypothetical protein
VEKPNVDVHKEEKRSVDWLLSEFSSVGDLFSSSEETGERRVNIFLTLASLLTAAFGITIQVRSNSSDSAIIQGGLIMASVIASLFIFGLFTLARLTTRNIASDEYKIKLDKIRSYFRKADDTLEEYLPFYSPDEIKIMRDRIKRWHSWYHIGSGGYVQTVALLNSILIGLAVIVLFSSAKPIWWSFIGVPVGAGVGLSSQYLQHRYAINKFREKICKLREDMRIKKLDKFEVDKSYKRGESLIIYSDQPKTDFERIMNELPIVNKNKKLRDPKFRFEQRDVINIEDRYYDTQDSRLKSYEIVLRIRITDEKTAEIKLIDETEQDDLTETQRWSLTGLENIIKSIRERTHDEISHALPENYNDLTKIEDVMNMIGLRRTTTIRCKRIPRIAGFRMGIRMKEFAEVEFNQISIEYDAKSVNYYNVDLELRRTNNNKGWKCQQDEEEDDSIEYLKELRTRLILRFDPNLVPWKHGKFIMFKTLSKHKDPILKSMQSSEGSLKKNALRKIDMIIGNPLSLNNPT